MTNDDIRAAAERCADLFGTSVDLDRIDSSLDAGLMTSDESEDIRRAMSFPASTIAANHIPVPPIVGR